MNLNDHAWFEALSEQYRSIHADVERLSDKADIQPDEELLKKLRSLYSEYERRASEIVGAVSLLEDPREIALLTYVYIERHTLLEAAKKFGYSKRHVQRIVSGALAKLLELSQERQQCLK